MPRLSCRVVMKIDDLQNKTFSWSVFPSAQGIRKSTFLCQVPGRDLDGITDVSHERISERIGKQTIDLPVPDVLSGPGALGHENNF